MDKRALVRLWMMSPSYFSIPLRERHRQLIVALESSRFNVEVLTLTLIEFKLTKEIHHDRFQEADAESGGGDS
jgi:hypothetical protein